MSLKSVIHNHYLDEDIEFYKSSGCLICNVFEFATFDTVLSKQISDHNQRIVSILLQHKGWELMGSVNYRQSIRVMTILGSAH
mmetsp:Transcript_23176/g.49355  ORF Transcript_23176/g.49355 Transcript_23176/m.49355 type:complete len:83 (-) Transcript_23176:1590-1838(-)